jgi:dihydrofolate reductase
MSRVLLDITVSLDGYVADADDSVDRLHRWVFAGQGTADPNFRPEVLQVIEDADVGVVIAGRRTFDLADGWAGEPGVDAPYVVLSHDVPEKVASGEWSRFTFVSGGVEEAVATGRKIAGDRTVYVMGGADIARQCVDAGLLDEIQLHVVPVLLGSGVRLFEHLEGRTELELVSLVEGAQTVRTRYRVVR